jgi:V8-like Glu-specific endopeptidase
MVSRRLSAIVALIAISATFALNPVKLCAQTTAGPVVTETDQQDAAVQAYWTADRMANAKPVPLPRADVDLSSLSTAIGTPPASRISLPGNPGTASAPADASQLFTPVPRESGHPDGSLQLENGDVQPEMYGGEGLRYTSSRLVGNAVASAEKQYPYRMSGQLFFVVPPGIKGVPAGNYVCSATVQTVGVIVEAGHCVTDGNNHFYNSWVFVPAERNGAAPFGKWTAHQEYVSNTWNFGGGGVPNDQDVSAIVLNKRLGNRIGNVVGWAGFSIPDLYGGQHVTVTAYPCNLDKCNIDHRTDAQASGGGGNTVIIGADGTGGSSGGGWFINYGEYAAGQPASGANDTTGNSIVGVTSYGPINTTLQYSGASILDNRSVQCVPLNTCSREPSAVLNYACFHNAGAC